MGQANASADQGGDLRPNHPAVTPPASTVKALRTGPGITCPRVENTGALNRQFWTYVPNEPMGTRPLRRNGTYNSPNKAIASIPSRRRTRFQYKGKSTIGMNFTPTASANASAAKLPRLRLRHAKDSTSKNAPTMSM